MFQYWVTELNNKNYLQICNQSQITARYVEKNQEYDSRYPFGWCVCAFDLAICLGTSCLELSKEFGIFYLTFHTDIEIVMPPK